MLQASREGTQLRQAEPVPLDQERGNEGKFFRPVLGARAGDDVRAAVDERGLQIRDELPRVRLVLQPRKNLQGAPISSPALSKARVQFVLQRHLADVEFVQRRLGLAQKR